MTRYFLILILTLILLISSTKSQNSEDEGNEGGETDEETKPNPLDEYFRQEDLTEGQRAKLIQATEEYVENLQEVMTEAKEVLSQIDKPENFIRNKSKYQLHWFANYSVMGNPFGYIHIIILLLPFLVGKIVKIVIISVFKYKRESEHDYDDLYVPKLMDLQQTKAESNIYMEERNTIIWMARKMKIEPEHIEREMDQRRRPKPFKFSKYRKSHWVFLQTMLKTFGAKRMEMMIKEGEAEAEKERQLKEKILELDNDIKSKH